MIGVLSREARAARNPRVLPDAARQFSVRIDPNDVGDDDTLFDLIELPDDLRSSVPKRQRQFRAGRYCAMRALGTLDSSLAVEAVPRGPTGAPVWPAGVTGSITHTDDFVSAAVVRRQEALALGIDSERIMSEERAREVQRVVAWPSELACARDAGLSRLEALTLVFSSKESLYKCVHPRVGRVFGFHDVRIERVDPVAGTFYARIARELSEEFPADVMLEGRFEIDYPWVHTGMLLRADFLS